MKPWMILACSGLSITLLAQDGAIAGDLQPPQGDVRSSMNALDVVEPRVCVNNLPGDEGATHLITQPGVYVFRADVVGEPGKDGVRIDATSLPAGDHQVSIAMRGFAMHGVVGAANAIYVHNPNPDTVRLHITITGSLADAPGSLGPTALIRGWSVDGVHVEGASSVSVQGLDIRDCLGDGLEVTACPGTGTSVRCFTSVFSQNGADGVRVTLPASGVNQLAVEEIESLSNGAHGARFLYAAGDPGVTGRTRIRMASMDCSRNALDGVRISIDHGHSISCDMDDLRLSGNGGDGSHVSVDFSGTADMSVDLSMSDCSASGNVFNGLAFFVTSAPTDRRMSVDYRRCSSSSNGGDGFRVDGLATAMCSATLTGCSATRNVGDGSRLESLDASITDFGMSRNTGSGISARNSRVRCADGSCRENSVSGIDYLDPDSDDDCVLDRVSCTDNGGSGVSANGGAVYIFSSVCGGNGGGPSGGDGFTATNLEACRCEGSSFDRNKGFGASVAISSSGQFLSCGFNGNGTGASGGDGLRVSECVWAHVERCVASDNVGNGVTLADLNRDGRLDLVMACGNGGAGVLFDSSQGLACGRASLRACVTNSNGLSGVSLACTTGGDVRRCESSGNGGAGISVVSLDHVIVESSTSGNTLGGVLAPIPGNSVGPAVDEGKINTNSNPGGNYLR